MVTQDRSQAGTRKKIILMSVPLTVALLVSGCEMPAITFGGASEFTDVEAQLRVWPEYRCPGEMVSISWYGGEQVPDCDPSLEGVEGACKHGYLDVRPPVFGRSLTGGGYIFDGGNTDLRGIEQVVPDPDDATYNVRYSVFAARTYRTALVDDFQLGTSRPWTDYFVDHGGESGAVQTVALNYEMVCDPDTRTYVLRRTSITPRDGDYPADYVIDSGELSPCLGVTHVCASRAAGTVSAGGVPGEPDAEAAIGEGGMGVEISCNLDAFDGYGLEDLSVNFTDPNFVQAGQPCVPGTPIPSASLQPYVLLVALTCMTPDQMQGAGNPLLSTAEQCENNWAMSTASEPLMSEPGGQSEGGLAVICNLEATCGNGVCDQGCEDASSCAQDCQSAGMTGQPEGTDGSQCGDGVCQAGEDASWCGDCIALGGDGGDSGQQQPPPPPPPQQSECGNQQCEAGETPTSCPIDCAPAPVCGDGVCDPSEQGCGVCSADCGPC